MATSSSSSLLGFDLPSITNIMNFDNRLDLDALNVKKNQLSIKLKNGEITKTQFNQFINELDTKPLFGTNSIIPDNVQSIFNNPKNITHPTIRSLVSLKPILVEKSEIKKAKNLIKLVNIKTETLNLDIYNKPFSPRLLNWVEPFDVAGFNKTLFYTDVNSGLKEGDRVFIINGNYDNDLLISIDKYKKGRDGYKVLSVDNCKIVLDINFTGILPYNDDELDDFIKVYYIRDKNEFLQINRQLTTRDGVFDYKYNQYQNTIAYFDDTYLGTVTGWGDNGGIPTPGFYVRSGLTSSTWVNITSNFILGSFSVALSPTYENNNRIKILNGSFQYGSKTYQENFIYKWEVGLTQSDWVVDVTYHKPFITKSNFRDGIFKGNWNTGLFGRQNKSIIWDGDGSKWQTGTLLNSIWKKGTMRSRYTSLESYFSDFDSNGLPFQKSNLTNNNGRGFNFIIDSVIESSTVVNGSIINTIFGTQSATYSTVENHLISATISYPNNILKAYFESSYINDMFIDSSEISNSRILNSRITKSKIINSKSTESIVKDSIFISDNIIKIEDYDEWSAAEYGPLAGTSNKIFKFYISKKNFERLKNKDHFYIKGLNFNTSSKEVLNFFDKKFTLSSWSDYSDEIDTSYQFYKRPVEYTAFLSTPLENEYKVTAVGVGIGFSYSTAIVDVNEKSQYSIDIMLKTVDTISYPLSGFNFNRDIATSSPSSPTMSNFIGNILDIKNAYIIDSDLDSGLIETSDWVNGNNINLNNDVNLTLPSLIGGLYNISLGSTTSRILDINLNYNNLYPEGDVDSLSVGRVVYLNSVYYRIDDYVSELRIIDGGSSYVAQSNITVNGITGSGLTVDFDAPLGTVSNVYINNPGYNYTIGSTVSIDDGDFNAILEVVSVTSSLTLLPNDFKIISNDNFGNIQVKEINSGTSSVFDTLRIGGFFYTPDAQNRYGYLYRSKFYKTKIKSGIFRRSFFVNSLIENDEYNVDDKDFSNLNRIRNLVVVDALFKNNRNILSNATYLYSHIVKGDNYWTNGIVQKSILNGMTFSNGVVKQSRWVDGLFNSGVFYESRTFDGEPSVPSTPTEKYYDKYNVENTRSYYKDGLTTITISNDRYSWQNGTFRVGTRNKTSEFYKSDWENGNFENGKFYYSKWYDGIINGGIFGDESNDASDTIVYNATISNVLVENASFYASDTSYNQSTQNKIIWQNGIFNDGVFGTNYQQTTASNVATWYDGEFNGGQFVSMAKWKNGIFNGGKFISGLGWTQSSSASQSLYGWEDGTFNNGEFGNAEGYTNSTWWKGQFNGGLFKGRIWNNGIFEKGEFQGSSTTSAVGGLSSSNANIFVDSFRDNFYGLWRDGYFTDQKDKLIKDTKIWTKVDRVEATEIRKAFIPTKISNALWLNGTFSHQSGIATNVVWLDGTFDKGKFYNSSFNPFVRRNEYDSTNVWDYEYIPESIYNGEFTASFGGWIFGSTTDGYSAYSTFSIENDQARFICDFDSPPASMTSSADLTESGIYRIKFDLITFSAPYNNLSLKIKTGNKTTTLLSNITEDDLGNHILDVELESGSFSFKGEEDGQGGEFTFDNFSIKKLPTSSFNTNDSCLWTDGNFENGDFYISNWEKGNFIIGTAYGMIWQSGISNYMNAFNIFWEDGIWKNGNWYGSAFEFNGTITDEFTKQILFRGMSWSGTSSCHIWNIFDNPGEKNFEVSSTASNPLLDSTIDEVF